MTFDEAYMTYYSQIDKYIFKHVHDPDLAQDLTQETFIKALCAWSRLEQDGVKAWLHVIALNTVRDYKRKRSACSLDKLMEHGIDFASPVSLESQYEASDTLRYLLNSEIGEQVRYQLDDDQCESGKELAQKYNINPGAAKNRTLRARRKVRQKFASEVA